MKRMVERTKQRLGIQGKAAGEWQPTSNKRNEAMEDEVRRFAQSLKLLHKTLGDLDASITGEPTQTAAHTGLRSPARLRHGIGFLRLAC
jgi:hypothetical protein